MSSYYICSIYQKHNERKCGHRIFEKLRRLNNECRTGKRSLNLEPRTLRMNFRPKVKKMKRNSAQRTSSLLSHRRTHLQIYSMIYMKDVAYIGIVVNVERKDFK